MNRAGLLNMNKDDEYPKKVHIRLRESTYKALRIYCISEDISMQLILSNTIEKMLKEAGKL
jgi:hypothetical protein